MSVKRKIRCAVTFISHQQLIQGVPEVLELLLQITNQRQQEANKKNNNKLIAQELTIL